MNCAEKALAKLNIETLKETIERKVFLSGLEAQIESQTELRLHLIPRHNPAVQQVKKIYADHLKQQHANNEQLHQFSREFEGAIKQAIKDAFGKDYDSHETEVQEGWFSQSEDKLLAKMSELKRVGLQEGESLDYVETFGQWRDVEALSNGQLGKAEESEQLNVTKLLTEHLELEPADSWKAAITFIAADFGKGKSVFMKHHAAMLADNYLDNDCGVIPIYFNLNEYHSKKYDNARDLGIIDSYLLHDFDIDIKDEHFKNKEYLFLIDSLDESGDLSQIQDVLNSVLKISKNASSGCPSRKIVIATRPIDRELSTAIGNYKVKLSAEEHPQFISLYGFKASQFDHWLKTTVTKANQNNGNVEPPSEDSIAAILYEGWQQPDFSAHELLKEREVLDDEELVKPLFAYILYQLLTNNISIPDSGKVGIYLAFLHYITSKAKFIEDKQIGDQKKIRQAEHSNRKVLHSIAALWCKQRSTGQSAVLDKNKINFSLLDTNTPNTQEKQQISQVDELKFLSHSYFGDNARHLHFQHQSFAEILLAEYYLKVFLSEALKRKPNIMRTRTYLFVGEPTVATMAFFAELIKLLVVSTTADSNKAAVAKKLLLPVLGSLAAPIFTEKLHSEYLYGKFYDYHQDELLDENLLLNDAWPINQRVLDDLTTLAGDILKQENSLRLTPAKPVTSLYDNELVLLEKSGDCGRPDVDKWLAITLAGLIAKEQTPRQYYFEDEDRGRQFFQLIQDSPQREAPEWLVTSTADVFHRLKLINMELRGINLLRFDFANGFFQNVGLRHSKIHCQMTGSRLDGWQMWDCTINCNFNKTAIIEVLFIGCRINHSSFNSLSDLVNLVIIQTSFESYQLPSLLLAKLADSPYIGSSFKSVVGSVCSTTKQIISMTNPHMSVRSLRTLIESAYKLGKINKEDITNSFEFMSESERNKFKAYWSEEVGALFTNIRDEPEYLALEQQYEKQTLQQDQRLQELHKNIKMGKDS
ncbi:MAG: hypothetical protein HRT35_07445 [Algicola sp.]|nr:hypothetical protein [Algicola sp.]